MTPPAGAEKIGTERTCPDDLLEQPEALAALGRLALRSGRSFDVLLAVGAEFVEYRTRGEGKGSTRSDWAGALIARIQTLIDDGGIEEFEHHVRTEGSRAKDGERTPRPPARAGSIVETTLGRFAAGK